jgi:hypothetical protein
LYLEKKCAEEIAEKFNLSDGVRTLAQFTRSIYAKVLESSGQKYLTGAGLPGDRDTAIALTAIVQQAHEDGILQGLTDGKFQLKGQIDWAQTKNKAQMLVPPTERSTYTSDFLKGVFGNYNFRRRKGGRLSMISSQSKTSRRC